MKNWGNYDVLRIELGKFVLNIFFYLWKLPCAVMFFVCNFGILLYWVFCICLSQSCFLICSYVWKRTPIVLYFIRFFSVRISWNCYVCLVPPHLQRPIIVCAVFASHPFVDPACGPSLPQGGNDYTYFYRYTRDFFFFSINILFSCCCYSTMNLSTSSYHSSSCLAAMGCSFKNFTSTWYQKRLSLYSLYPISGPCSFSKFIAYCITCRRNGTGRFSLISPDVSFLNSKISLYPAAPRGLVTSSLYEILCGIWIPAHAIAISISILDVVILSFPTVLFLYGSILFLFLLSITAPGAVRFCILCNIPSSRHFYPPFPSPLPNLFLPSISRAPFPSCRKYAVHTPRT